MRQEGGPSLRSLLCHRIPKEEILDDPCPSTTVLDRRVSAQIHGRVWGRELWRGVCCSFVLADHRPAALPPSARGHRVDGPLVPRLRNAQTWGWLWMQNRRAAGSPWCRGIDRSHGVCFQVIKWMDSIFQVLIKHTRDYFDTHSIHTRIFTAGRSFA